MREDFVTYYSGKEGGQEGVAFVIPKRIDDYVTGYEAISPRLISIKIKAKPRNLHIVQVYAPTSTAEDEILEDFYSSLETVMKKAKSGEILVVMGDFNAKLGNTKADNYARLNVGYFGMGARNQRGERFLQFCIENSLTVTNTLFQQHVRRLYIWTSPGGEYKNQIDYILIKSRWRTSIKMAKTLPGADCGSDHQLLIAKFTTKLKRPIRTSIERLPLMSNSQSFSEDLERSIEAEWNDLARCTIEELWTKFKELMGIVAGRTQPRRQMNRQVWISPETFALIEERRKLKAKGLEDRDNAVRYAQLSREIQRKARRDKNNYLNNICAEIQAHADTAETKDLFMKIKQITRKFKPRSWVIHNSEGELMTEIEEIAETWRQYCKKLYEDPNYVPEESEIHVDQMEPSILRSEVEAAIKKLGLQKSAGIDGITAEYIKAAGPRAVDIIWKLCQNIWISGEWPGDWQTSVVIPLHKKGTTKECDNFRLISLISHVSKVMLYILQKRLKHFIS